jgi:hypothetical protein
LITTQKPTKKTTSTKPPKTTKVKKLTTSTKITTKKINKSTTTNSYDYDYETSEITKTPIYTISQKFVCPQSSGIFPDQQDCQLFWHCSNNRPYQKRCSGNLVFDRRLKTCSWRNAECIKSPLKSNNEIKKVKIGLSSNLLFLNEKIKTGKLLIFEMRKIRTNRAACTLCCLFKVRQINDMFKFFLNFLFSIFFDVENLVKSFFCLQSG